MKEFMFCFQTPTPFQPLKGQMLYCWDFSGIRGSLQKAVKYNLVEHCNIHLPAESRTRIQNFSGPWAHYAMGGELGALACNTKQSPCWGRNHLRWIGEVESCLQDAGEAGERSIYCQDTLKA